MHTNIDFIERKQQGMTGGVLWLKCKDLRVLQLDIIGADEFIKVADSLEGISRAGKKDQHLFSYFNLIMYIFFLTLDN